MDIRLFRGKDQPIFIGNLRSADSCSAAVRRLAFGDYCLEGVMQDQTHEMTAIRAEQPAPTMRNRFSPVWRLLSGLSLILAAAALATRLAAGPRFDELLILSAVAPAAFLALRLLVHDSADPEAAAAPAGKQLKELFDSAGPGVMAISLDGRLTYMNPSAERMLGYRAAELMKQWATTDILAPGEGTRLVAEMEKLCAVQRPPEPTPAGRMAAYMNCVQTLPPNRVPSFDAQLRRKNGVLIPVTLHISALRDGAGALSGLAAVAVDRTATLRQEQALRESQERYRDLFENSSEMIATLSPAGKFLYANPAWKRCFGQDNAALLALDSIEDLFCSGCRGEVAALIRRALDGEVVDRAPLRHHTPDGRVLELELSLSQRQKAGNPLAVRCLLRDVTRQKQREHRLALQLEVSQIVGENTSPEVAALRILEALCVSQGWDLAIKWEVNAEDNQLEFSTAWGSPESCTGILIQECAGLTLARGSGLSGRAWAEGRTVWIADLASLPVSPRIQSALRREMASGWAAPVRVGNKILAVLEFYCHSRLREDREAIAAVETVAASLGQMLARSRERGRAEDLYRQQEILLDSVDDGICGVDRRGLVSFANPAAARLLGAAASSLTGRPVHDLLHSAAAAGRPCNQDCPLRRSSENHKAVAGEDVFSRSDGSTFPVEYVLTPILKQGRFSGSVLSFRDISHRYALDRLKDEFISTVSHELRTPLTSIRGALGLLSSGILGQVNDKAANLLRIALTNSDRLVRLINDILDLERIQSGREPLAFRPVLLAEIVRQAIDSMAPVAEAAGVQLVCDTAQVEIEADPDRLLQVLTNLLSNAVKFSPSGATVSVMLRPEVNGVILSVIDQGRGIPADKLDAIFGRFQQVDASDSRQKGGTGLGLAICRTIVQQHSGRIWAECNPVSGSTFRVYLPYKPAFPDSLETPDGLFDQKPGQETLSAPAAQGPGLDDLAQLASDGRGSNRPEFLKAKLPAWPGR
jgi:PAS domain S-box-containing protein